MKRYLCIFLGILLIFVVSCSMEAPSVINNYTLSVSWKGEFSYPPSNPESGWAYYDTTKKASFVWDGDSWEVLSKDGKSIEWKGELEKAPSNPQENWAYYNVIEGNSYIYTKNGWNYLAKSGRDGSAGIMLWLGSLSESPANPTTGTCYYDINKKASYIWDGDSWEVISKDGVDGVSGKDGVSILWKGALPSSPNSPKLNWAYFNTTDRKSYIFDGMSWQLFSESIGGDTNVVVSINWLGTFASAPSNPQIGQAYYNAKIGASYIYDGSVWQQISKDGVSPEIEGYLINWKGESNTAPENPKAGWTYYNNSDNKTYIFDGITWQVMLQNSDSNQNNENIYDPTNNAYLTFQYQLPNGQTNVLDTTVSDVIDFGTNGINSSVETGFINMFLQGKKNGIPATINLLGNPPIKITGKDADSFTIIQPQYNYGRDWYNNGLAMINDVKIIFNPTSLGKKEATITILNNSDNCPTLTFTVRGTCDYFPQCKDGGEGDGIDGLICSVIDSLGNTYFAGYGFELVNNHSGFDCWIKKYDNKGAEDIINWNKKIDYFDDYWSDYAPYSDFVNNIICLSNDEIIISTPHVLLKYSTEGKLQWELKYLKDKINKIYKDSNDNIFVVFENTIKKINASGIEQYTLNTSGNISLNSNTDFAVYKDSTINIFENSGKKLIQQDLGFVISDIMYSNNDEIYICGYKNDSPNFEKKNAIVTKYSMNESLVELWKNEYSWNHCDDEIATQLYIVNNSLVVVGNGNDLISGSSKSDTWIKQISLDGNDLKTKLFDIEKSILYTHNFNNSISYFIYDLYSLMEIDLDGNILHTYRPDIACDFLDYLITDKYIYCYGTARNYSSITKQDIYINRFIR